MRDPIINYSNWEQLRLFPPEQVRMEVVMYLDGQSESISIGWRITEEPSDEIIELGVDMAQPISFGMSRWHEVSELLWEKCRAVIGPF